MKKYYTDNIIQFPTQNTKQVQPAGKDVILFTPENFGQPGVKTMEFTFDLDGMVGAFESGNKDWMQMIPPTMLDQLVDAIDLDGSRKEITVDKHLYCCIIVYNIKELSLCFLLIK